MQTGIIESKYGIIDWDSLASDTKAFNIWKAWAWGKSVFSLNESDEGIGWLINFNKFSMV